MAGQSLGELAQRFNLELDGDPDHVVTAIAPLYRAQADELSFLVDKRRLKELETTQAGALVLHRDLQAAYRGNKLLSRNAHADFARIAALLHEPAGSSGEVHSSAVIASGAHLAKGVEIGPNVSIGEGVRIGHDSIIGAGTVIEGDVTVGCGCTVHANVTIAQGSRLGDRVILHHGAVIGADGFGLAQDGETWLKVPQVGRVVVGDDVEVGANTTIDRGAMDDTVIGSGVKLDNLIQVAHNVKIGDHTAIAACVGIAGSAVIGKRCTIGGAAVVLGHLEITDDVHITAMSLVTKSIGEAGTYSSGTPLEKNANWHRNFIRFKHLDEMAKRLTALERKISDRG